MLEQKLESLEHQVGELTAAIGLLNESLEKRVLSPAVNNSTKSVEETQKKAVAPQLDSKSAADAEQTLVEPKVEDVRKALVDLALAKGKAQAKELLSQFGAVKVGDIEQSQYNSIIEKAVHLKEVEAC